MLRLSRKSKWAALVGGVVLVAIAVKLALAITPFVPGNQPVGYVAQDEITNYNLKSGTEILYRVEYEKEFYSGNLFAYPVDEFGNVERSPEWWGGGAQSHIDGQDFDTGRMIATMKDSGTGAGAGIPFRFTSLSTTQQGYLTSSTVLDFLRGDRSQEIPNSGKTLRQRKSVLGDMIHSRPYYVADSSNPTVFVGANDGMLHAFDAATSGGAERWAYVPSMLISKMKNLSVSPYVHDYFVDGQINIADISSSGSKRILVGGLGGGGRGLYALDITGSDGLTASNEAGVASKVMWEITPTKVNYANPTTTDAYVNLGYTYGTPSIAKVGGADRVIIGNGYNDSSAGDYQAYLFVINPYTGQRIGAIQAGTSGTATSPNGLSTPVAVDNDGDGSVDIVYAGDLNGTMWKFNLSNSTATALLTTTEAITSTPGVFLHPNGGYMVNFGTGKQLTAADSTDVTTVYHVYGIWDGAAGSGMVTQTLTERAYTNGSTTTRVRTVTANQPNWATDKGWQVTLPAGERVLGEGSFIENGRFYFTSHNPTISTTVPNTTTVVQGTNWLMELDGLTGGTKTRPFLDMNGDVKVDDADRVKYSATDTLPVTTPATVVGDPNLTTNGIPVGKFLSIGVLSQPILVQLVSLNDTLFNQNPDVVFPTVTLAETGVTGGHFDADIFYGTASGGSSATAVITVSSTGSSRPATLGGISVDGVSIVGALSTSNITNGTSTSTNASTIKNRVAGGFTATVSGNKVTVKAPVGAAYNGKTFTFTAGTSSSGSPAIPGVRPTGLISFSGTTSGSSAAIDDSLDGSSVRVGNSSAEGSRITLGNRTPAEAASRVVSVIGNGSGNDYRAYVGGNSITPTCAIQPITVVCLVDNTTYTNGRAVTIGSTSNFGSLTVSVTATAGGVPAVAATAGWDNFATALSGATFSGGADGVFGDTCTDCNTKSHTHQYDDKFDVTGVDMLNPSEPNLRLSKAIASTSAAFKVLALNQYLSPAVKLHLHDTSYRPIYQFNVDAGYVSLKNYLTSATLDLATLPTYTRASIGSLAINMPLDALTSKDWWGTGDVRSGLHAAGNYLCPIKSATSSNDGNMFRPVVPPANGVAGPGTAGWSGSSTPATASGVRHNGALTIQVISASTPNSAIEQNVSGRPEYGWRVKSASYASYVLAEYVYFWHTPHPVTHAQNTGPCYHDAGWTKSPARDATFSALSAKAAGSTDPKIGDLSAGVGSGTTVSTTISVSGNVTTTDYVYSGDTPGSNATKKIVRTVNTDGTVTIVTTDVAGNVTTQIVAVTSGSVKSGGDELGLMSRTGRISWRELVSP
jgi:hypothetical protein